MSLRAGSETRRWPAPEQAARAGRSGGERTPRRGAAPLRTRTRYQEPRTALPLPAPLAFSARLESWSSRVATAAAEPLVPGSAIARGRRPGPPTIPGPWPRVLRGARSPRPDARNFDSRELEFPRRWPWEDRRSLHSPHPVPGPANTRALCSPRLAEDRGLGCGESFGNQGASGSSPVPFCALGPHLDSGMGRAVPPPRTGYGAGGT